MLEPIPVAGLCSRQLHACWAAAKYGVFVATEAGARLAWPSLSCNLHHADIPWLLLQDGQHTTADQAAALMAAAEADVREGQPLEAALTAEAKTHAETEVKLILMLPYAASGCSAIILRRSGNLTSHRASQPARRPSCGPYLPSRLISAACLQGVQETMLTDPDEEADFPALPACPPGEDQVHHILSHTQLLDFCQFLAKLLLASTCCASACNKPSSALPLQLYGPWLCSALPAVRLPRPWLHVDPHSDPPMLAWLSHLQAWLSCGLLGLSLHIPGPCLILSLQSQARSPHCSF